MNFADENRYAVLSILNEELNTQYDRLADAFSDWRERQSQDERADAVGVCGFPCMGDCSTCVESDAALTAFFAQPDGVVVAAAPEPAPAAPAPIVSEASASVEGSGPSYAEEPVEGQQMAYAGDESQNSALEAARAMDAIEEAQRSGEAYDDADEYRGCNCLDCLNHDDPDYRSSYYDDRDDGYGGGLDWNESGYFD